jgi:hypothetical protein
VRRKRRWRCDEPSCRRRSFTEAVGSVPSRKRLTTRLRASTGAAAAGGGSSGRTVVQSARDHDVSWPIVLAAFIDHATTVLPEVGRRRGHTGVDDRR